MRITPSVFRAVESAAAKGAVEVPRLFSVAVGILIGLLIVIPPNRQTATPAGHDLSRRLSDIERMSPDEIQALIAKGLATLGEQQGLGARRDAAAEEDSRERVAFGPQDVQQGVKNVRRLLPSVKRWTSETLRHAAAGYDLKHSGWPPIDRLISGVRKIVRNEHLRAMAAVRDERLSEILVDPAYAPYLNSDDEAVFVLAHELMHVAARSGALNRFIEGVAENARRSAHVEPTEDQREDLACDFVGELVLRRYIADNPTNESVAVRVSRVLGYKSPADRFAQAWEDFCASYNGDPGDDDHLNQYQTIRALFALDPDLASLMPIYWDNLPSRPTDKPRE